MRRLDMTQSEVIRRALGHMLATLERGDAVHVAVPSEQREPE